MAAAGLDRRTTPFSGRVAASWLRGQLQAEAFVEPELLAATGNPFLLATPGGARDRQMLTGDPLELYERRDGWAYVRAVKDGYCGWLPVKALAPYEEPSARVAVRSTWLCPAPTVRQPAHADLHLGARLVLLGEERDGWTRVRCGGIGGWLPTFHIAPLQPPERDPVAVARRFLGTPYFWGGNTGFGIDCSGLVQAALLACGVACPGDSDLQAAALGRELAPDEEPRPGDLYVARGHVAMLAAPDMLIHSTGHAMQVVEEPLAEVLARAQAEGKPMELRRRIELP